MSHSLRQSVRAIVVDRQASVSYDGKSGTSSEAVVHRVLNA
jgi:hypothetical protein